MAGFKLPLLLILMGACRQSPTPSVRPVRCIALGVIAFVAVHFAIAKFETEGNFEIVDFERRRSEMIKKIEAMVRRALRLPKKAIASLFALAFKYYFSNS